MNRITNALRMGSICAALCAGGCSDTWIDTLACASPDGPYGPNTSTCDRAHSKLRADHQAKNSETQFLETFSKETKEDWSRLRAQARAENRAAIRAKYPKTGWLSGIWCEEDELKSKRRVERSFRVDADDLVMMQTYTPATKQYRFNEKLSKRVKVGRDGSGYAFAEIEAKERKLFYTPGSQPVRPVLSARIQKISNNRFRTVNWLQVDYRYKSQITDAIKQKYEIRYIPHRRYEYKQEKIFVRCG